LNGTPPLQFRAMKISRKKNSIFSSETDTGVSEIRKPFFRIPASVVRDIQIPDKIMDDCEKLRFPADFSPHNNGIL
jgi:hypothetical protein